VYKFVERQIYAKIHKEKTFFEKMSFLALESTLQVIPIISPTTENHCHVY
jgi:hypothetical protein